MMKNILVIILFLFSSQLWAQEEDKEEKNIDYLKRGSLYYKQGKYKYAIKDFDKAIKKNNTKYSLFQYRAKAKRKIGNYKESLKDYNQAIRLNPNFTKAYLGRAQTYSLLKEYKKGLADYEIVLKQKPKHPKRVIIYFNQAVLLGLVKDYKGALENYNKVLQLDKNFSKAYTNRGNILYLKGDVRGACADWQQSKDLENAKGKVNVEKACQ